MPKPSNALLEEPNAATAGLQRHLSVVYSRSQSSNHLFASPLGPFSVDGRQAYLPRFAFFGPLASEDSWRLAILGGLAARDFRSSHALLALAEQLTEEAEHGHGLDVAFFPIVDAAGLFLDTPDRELNRGTWAGSPEPELQLLEKDLRFRRYHGFIRLETADPGEEVASIRICGTVAELLSPDLALITTEDTAPFPVRFEGGLPGGHRESGPLSLATNLAFDPFELTLRIPASWPDDIYRSVVVSLLRRFLMRYRAFQAYGQNL